MPAALSCGTASGRRRFDQVDLAASSALVRSALPASAPAPIVDVRNPLLVPVVGVFESSASSRGTSLVSLNGRCRTAGCELVPVLAELLHIAPGSKSETKHLIGKQRVDRLVVISTVSHRSWHSSQPTEGGLHLRTRGACRNCGALSFHTLSNSDHRVALKSLPSWNFDALAQGKGHLSCLVIDLPFGGEPRHSLRAGPTHPFPRRRGIVDRIAGE